MDNIYQLKDLAELIPLEPLSSPMLAIWDCYGDRLIRFVANQEGLWLCKQGRGFDERTDGEFTGLSARDIAEKKIEGFGTVYSTKAGAPILPIPFTAHELLIFNAQLGGLITEINKRGEFEREWIAELRERNADAADLAATILYGDLPMDAGIYPPKPGIELAQEPKPPVPGNEPEQASTSPAVAHARPIAGLVISGGDAYSPAKRAEVHTPGNEPSGPIFSMTKAALIAAHEHEWPTIERDIKDASGNGLSKARAGNRDWKEVAALQWARSKNKLIKPQSVNSLAAAMGTLPSKVHRIQG